PFDRCSAGRSSRSLTFRSRRSTRSRTTRSTKREQRDLVFGTRYAHGTLEPAGGTVEERAVDHEAPESGARALRICPDEAANSLRRRLPAAARRDVPANRSGRSAASAGVA